MSRLATSFVLGYHGCEDSVAERAIAGEIDLLQSNKDFDWLGPGAYFWESDPDRALEWAEWKVERGEYKAAAVVGAVIDLRNCLDLLSRRDVEHLRAAHASFVRAQEEAGLQLPVNRSVPGAQDPDRVLRYLDCAVIKHLHSILDSQPEGPDRIEPFDTVRGLFTEGDELYGGSAFKVKTHIQLAVRNPGCIRGLFRPR